MSLYGALFSGVSALQSQSSAMGAISDNISNVNTIGYKATDVNFQTLVTTQVATTEYSPGGVQSKPRAAINVQGLLQATNSSTDIALSGQGFFIVNSAATPASEGGSFGYTRAGSFTPNSAGYLQNSAGFYLQGWPLTPTDNSPAAVPGQETINGTTYMKAYKNTDGTYHYINDNIINSQEVQPLNLNTIGGTSQPTSNVAMGANLPSGDPVYDPANPSSGGIHTTNVLTYDSLGNTGNSQFTWTKTGPNSWSLAGTPPSGAAVLNLTNYSTADGSMIYASQGQLEFNSLPPVGSYFQIGPSSPKATNPTVEIKFFNTSVSGSSDPTTDTPNTSNVSILGVDLNGVTNTNELTTAIQTAITGAANSPSVKKTYTIAATLLGGVADGASRFVANSNVLRIIQEPKAAAIQVNCVSNATTLLGNSIAQSATGVGSSTITPGVFTVPTIYDGGSVTNTPAYGTYSSLKDSQAFTVANSLGTSGTTTFEIAAATPPTGNFNITTSKGLLTIPWANVTGVAAVPDANVAATFQATGSAVVQNVTLTLPATGVANPATGSDYATNIALLLASASTNAYMSPYVTAAANGNAVSITNAGDTNNTGVTFPNVGQVFPTSITPDSGGATNPAEVTWADSGIDVNAAAGAVATETATPSGNLQIGKMLIPWSQINSGLISSYLDDGTTTATLPPTVNNITPFALPNQPIPNSQAGFTVVDPAGAAGTTPDGSFEIKSSAGDLVIPWASIITSATPLQNATFNGVAITPNISNLPHAIAANGLQIAQNLAALLGDINMTAYLPTSGFSVTASANAGVATNGDLHFASTAEGVTINSGVGNTKGLGNWGNGTIPTANGPLIGALSPTQSAENAAAAINHIGQNPLNGVTATYTANAPTSVTLTSGANPTQVFANEGGVAKDILWANGVDASLSTNAQVLGQTGIYSTSTGQAVSFNGDGTPKSIIPNTMELYWANGAENQVGTSGSSTIKPQMSLNFGNLNESNGLTQLGGNYQVNYLTQNGAKFGNFSGVSIATSGIVTALFDNGVRSPVFQIPIATFANPDGMQGQTGNVYIDTSNSGAYTLRAPGEAGSGTVAASSLEASTVDLGTQFTNMITVQNAYSAAAKIITTTNQMLTDLINIKQ
ncbi:MAG TPA: flagellar hook-basal body complex protein [Rhodospirillaceae bacterium]|nr:flagellar hook-basal body complex protein [Rhodospirillaceae bacterium]